MVKKGLFERLFEGSSRQNIIDILRAEEEKLSSNKEHDYELDILGTALTSQDLGWEFVDIHKKVLLVNVQDCLDTITVSGMAKVFRGTGHYEWEFLLAGLLITEILEAQKQGKDCADITIIFNRHLTAENERFNQDQILIHLINHFEVVKNEPDELWLRLKTIQ